MSLCHEAAQRMYDYMHQHGHSFQSYVLADVMQSIKKHHPDNWERIFAEELESAHDWVKWQDKLDKSLELETSAC